MSKIGVIQKCLIIGIAFLFIFSIITPLVIGNKSETNDRELIANLAFDCYDRFGCSKTKYYKEYLKKLSSEEIESGDVDRTFEKPSTCQFDGTMNSPWPMKCHDTRHTSRSPYSTEGNNGVEIWKFYTDGWVDSSPCIGSDGTIYFGGNYNELPWYLFALNPNGTLKWKYKTGGLIWSCPAIAEDGTIYIGTYDCKLYAINPNGSLNWKCGTGGSISSSPAIASDGTIYFGTMKGFDKGDIYAVNPDGTKKWSYETNYYILSDPAIGDDGTVYIGSGDTYLYALNPDGTLKWRFKTGDVIKAHPSVSSDGTVYISSFDDYFYAINPDGTLKWKFHTVRGNSCVASIGEDGTIYVGANDLFALYPNGNLKWKFGLGNRQFTQSSPAISSDGTIYFGVEIGDGNGGEIIAVNSNGTERWRKRIANDWVTSSPCIGQDGTIYVGSSSGNATVSSYGYLHAIGPSDANQPPDRPTINGTTSGNIGVEYNYTFIADDPELDDIYYYIDWGDGQIEEWVGPKSSGEILIISHNWSEEDAYTIKAKTKDIYEHESDWTELEVSMPKTKDRMYLISFNSYLGMEYDTSPFNEPLEINVSHTLPINISYWTNIPDFFSRIPFQITNNFLFRQSISPLKILHIDVLNTPDWANIYFSPDLILTVIPYKSEGTKTIECNLIISLYPEAPPEQYKLDIELSCNQIKRLKGTSYQESIDFTPGQIEKH